jgi:hypothetical protein
LNERKKDREMFERIGYVTFTTAGRLTEAMIKSQTGFDFKERAVESRTLYFESLKDPSRGMSASDARSVSEAFATVVFRSVGRKSLAEPLAPVSPPQHLITPEWTPISLHVGIFFQTIPQGYYDTFKNMLREASDHFPYDEEIEYD